MAGMNEGTTDRPNVEMAQNQPVLSSIAGILACTESLHQASEVPPDHSHVEKERMKVSIRGQVIIPIRRAELG